ncbi:MAG: acyltransferase family protein [Ilumatobacteraceae bacterium]
MRAERTIPYQPALDGVRALAVIVVLLFHGGVSWMTGGYLGVSTFFTLSGFLITSLLVREAAGSGRIDAGRFYARRARRLLPASLVCLAAVCLLAAGGAFDGVSGMRGDVLGALLQVFNWVKLASGRSYADLTTAASGLRHPLDHAWSLSIEEQFYWVWPVAVLGLLRLARRRPGWSLLRTVAVLYVLSAAAAPVIAAVWGPDAAYWATPARASEILAGALLACWRQARADEAGRPATRDGDRLTPARIPSPRRALAGWLGVGCLAVLGVACVTFPAGSGLAYRGALPLIGMLSAGLILGLQVDGPLRRLLSARPLVGIGAVSYGLYLYHWPVFVLVDRQRWALPSWSLLAIKVAITAAVTVASYVVVERPVRRAVRVPVKRTLSLGLTASAVVAALVVLVPQPAKFYSVDAATARDAAIDTTPVAPLVPLAPTTATAGTAGSTTPPPTPAVATSAPPSTAGAVPSGVVTTTAVSGDGSTPTAGADLPAVTDPPAPTTTVGLVPPRPVRILVAGDSTAEATGNGLISWAAANPDLAQVSLAVQAGCGFVPGGYTEAIGVVDRDVDKNCRHYLRDALPGKVRELRPDVVVMMSTSWDVFDRKLRLKSDPILPVTDPQVSAVVHAAMADVTNEMLSLGVSRVVWLREPIPNPFWQNQLIGQTNPAAHQVLYDSMAALAADNPAVRVVDLAGWADANGVDADIAARPDGTHWAPAASAQIAEQFLGPAIVRASLT